MLTNLSRRSALGGMLAGGLALNRWSARSDAACCYFAAKDKDINQPGQKAFLTWNPQRREESFTVQPKFEGNASDFGMVVPTPARPRLDEMPRDFFAMLAVFTILEPMPPTKFKVGNRRLNFAFDAPGEAKSVVVLEQGVVGSLDYKIIRANDARALYRWLDEHDYHYAGDEQTLEHYISKHWFFTVMKIDPKQMKRRPDGSYQGDVTPTRFGFESDQLVYPLRITQLSVRDVTEALFYVQAPQKMDLAGSMSYQFVWQPMWAQAMSFAVVRTPEEDAWLKHVNPLLSEYRETVSRLKQDRIRPTTLEWAKRLTGKDLGVLDGKVKYNRDAPPKEVKKLKILSGHLREGQVLTKFRRVFHKREMHDDLLLARASAGGRPDNTAYYQILPTSPP